MTLSDFEDPTELSRCMQADCGRYRLNEQTPLCALHLRQQEISAGAHSIVEPDLEAKVALIRSEDDEHPGEKKVWHEDGTFEWVDDPEWTPPVRVHELHQGPPTMTLEEFAEQQTRHSPSLGPQTPPEAPQRPSAGCWVAYHPDWSGFALFDDEVDALRHAVSNSMSIGRATWGQELGGGRYPASAR